jgi:hypothetical protein
MLNITAQFSKAESVDNQLFVITSDHNSTFVLKSASFQIAHCKAYWFLFTDF